MLKFPENTARFSWTRHIKNKMVFYNLSGAQIMRIFSNPERREEGIAPGTIGAMKTRHVTRNAQRVTQGETKNDTRYKLQATRKPREEEIWIMYKLNAKRYTQNAIREAKSETGSRKAIRVKQSAVTMISTWRYPGKTKVGERPAIPEGLLEELAEEGVL